MMLADMGAEVVKVEPPGEGGYARRALPQVAGTSLYTFIVNRNKKILALDLRDPDAQANLRDLIAQADVLVENFRPGTMEKMVLGWEHVHALDARLMMTPHFGLWPGRAFGPEGMLRWRGAGHERPDGTHGGRPR